MTANFLPGTNQGKFEPKFGYNPNLDATGTPKDITPFGDAYWPASVVAAADIDIASSSGDDILAGSGAQRIKIFGLDAAGLEIDEEIDLDGTDDVHPAKDYLRIYRAQTVAVDDRDEINVGNIVIDIAGANTMAYILAGFNKTTQAAYTIPADYKKAHIIHFDAGMTSTAASKSAQGQLWIRPPGEIWTVERVWDISSSVGYIRPYKMIQPLKPLTDVRLTIFAANAAALLIFGNIDLYLER